MEEIRFIQRFDNFLKAFSQFESAVEIAKSRKLSDLEEQGLIQSFEYTHELAWNVLKDFLTYQGFQNIYGSKDATKEAFAAELIKNGDIWMEMINSRNKTTHTYNQETANEITLKIKEKYFLEFLEFKNNFTKIKEKTLNNL